MSSMPKPEISNLELKHWTNGIIRQFATLLCEVLSHMLVWQKQESQISIRTLIFYPLPI